jgi:hypothetical protein
MAEGIGPPGKDTAGAYFAFLFFLAEKLDRAVREANHSMPSVRAAASGSESMSLGRNSQPREATQRPIAC